MESILKVLIDPGAWFNAIFFWLVISLIKWSFQRLPSGIRGYTRKTKLKRARRLAQERKNEFLVFHAISRANANYTIFILFSTVYLFGILFSPFRLLIQANWPVFFLLLIPILVVEFVWLISDGYAQNLVKARRRLRARL